ncbi:MAG: glycosyltransferase [Leptospirales bacterium]
MMKKILIYHWVQDSHPKQLGGGVQYYQKNLVQNLMKRNGISLFVLSSGRSYQRLSPRTRIIPTPSEDEHLKRFDIVNSGVPAPSVPNFSNRYSIEHRNTVRAFEHFLLQNGPFDVIHFNHFEGLPASILTVKKKFPNTKFVFTLHDYYVFCPAVNLVYQEQENCEDNQGGKKCLTCRPLVDDPMKIVRANALVSSFEVNVQGLASKVIRKASDLMTTLSNTYEPLKDASPLETFSAWKEWTDLINEHVDWIIAPSRRAREIALERGINSGRLYHLDYGVPEAAAFNREKTPRRGKILGTDGTLKMIFMGYLNHIKGFYFLLEAFEKMPESMSKRINLIVPAQKSMDLSAMNRLLLLKKKLNSLTQLNGYTQKELDGILKNCDIGILSHIWDETGPFTAWEMICRGVPYLTSDRGGPPEISNCPELTFTHGSVKDFIKRVHAVLDGKVTHETFWKNAVTPLTVDEHTNRLLTLYEGLMPAF